MLQYNTVIILVNYNSLDDTIECVKSIAGTTENQGVFTLVIDNGSVKKENINALLSITKHIHIIESEKNVGFGNANNIGIDWVKNNVDSKYIFLLNNDTVIDKDTIKKLTEAIAAAPGEVAMVAPKILVYSNPTEIWYEGGNIDYKKMTPGKYNNPQDYTLFASGCAMFFKAANAISLNGFDPFFFMYDEDVELSIRIEKMGLKILYVPEAIVYHKCQGSQTKQENLPSNQLHPSHPSLLFYLNNTIVNRKYIINKHLNGPQKYKSRFFHSVYWLMKSAQYLIYGKPKAFGVVLNKLILTSPKS